MIGHDVDKNEYWPYFYKEQFSMLFVKKYSDKQWLYYDSESDIVKLEESLCKKGI